MPIEFFQSPNGPSVKPSFDAPTVYLDHWAMRLFSDDHVLQDRFVAALMAKRGTILLSEVSLYEFVVASDSKHCIGAEAFLERVLPNIFFTDFDLRRILERERKESDNARRFWPPADLTQLKFFVERAQTANLGFTMHGLIQTLHTNRSSLLPSFDRLKQQLLDGLENARGDFAYVRKARNVQPSNDRTRTFVIIGELMRGFNLDPNAPIAKNDAIDLLHAAMPINCCDYVLLDNAWAERVEKMKQRIVKSSMNMPLAKCFSQRNSGIEAFLKDLEAFNKDVQIGPPIP